MAFWDGAPGYVARLIQDVQVIRLRKTDARVQAVTESKPSSFRLGIISESIISVMSILRMVKMFGWENKVVQETIEKREEELLTLCDATDNDDGDLYYLTVVMKQELSASKVFSSMAVFDMLRSQLRMADTTINFVVGAKVSLDRVNDFLHKTELLDIFMDNDLRPRAPDDAHKYFIGIKDSMFTWNEKNEGSFAPECQFSLKVSGELIFHRGRLNLITGPTGTGKTSLLMALLGELHFSPYGEHSWYNLSRDSGVAYAAQDPWIQNTTIRDNILFGSHLDEDRYNEVLHQCALEHDLSLFPAGDQTEVGERGLTLSGGQKARISLARAVYSEAAIVLLDDVLAALDVHTSQWVIDRCLFGDLMEGRTVLVVTHNLSIIHRAALIISIDSEGNVSSQTSPILAHDKDDTSSMKSTSVDAQASSSVNPIDSDGKLTSPESVERGHVNRKALKLYFSALSGDHPVSFFLASAGGLFLSLSVDTIQTWYLGYWASQYEKHPASEVHAGYYISVYGSSPNML
ncbi:hypothetical protein H0H92_015093 [Tricholoma furcatifolium]|nr:hypothetical protein H0H92_015093 [Tricholoma furcatifolium]